MVILSKVEGFTVDTWVLPGDVVEVVEPNNAGQDGVVDVGEEPQEDAGNEPDRGGKPSSNEIKGDKEQKLNQGQGLFVVGARVETAALALEKVFAAVQPEGAATAAAHVALSEAVNDGVGCRLACAGPGPGRGWAVPALFLLTHGLLGCSIWEGCGTSWIANPSKQASKQKDKWG